ncbi:MAG TPA: DNA recombination protein RmuC [Rhodanobacteraceae bacterium]|nr:DNA recombination protein RmuC [Rhodanobacteraceae bacterium]
MPNLTPLVALIAGLAAGVLAGIAIVLFASRRRSARAHAAGRASRDGEIAVLAEQRSAAAARADELAHRVDRFERDAETSTRDLREAAARAAGQQARAERLESDLVEARRIREGLQHRIDALSASHAALEASSREQLQAAAEKLALLDQAEQRLRDSFQNLAASILEDKAKHLREQSEQQLGGLLDPLKLQLREFRETVSQTHASEQRERGMLAQEIQSLKQLNQRISEDAINLTRALKGDSRTQGAWGELVLERVLEASGLSAGRDYETQVTFRNDDGTRPRPDVIVHLPDSKDIVVDSKVSLKAYERYVASGEDGLRAAALNDHVASLRRHVDELSARNYDDIEKLRTLDFVLLFIPVEAAFIEAVRADANLYGYALAKNISLVSPSTLLATLRTVAHLWRIEQRNVNAMEIARRAAQLHDNFALLVNELGSVGLALDKAQRAHASALRRLREGGKGSVLLQVQSLAEMGAPVKKQLSLLESAPAELVDEAAEPEAPAAGAGTSAKETTASGSDVPKAPSVVPLKART